MSATRKPEKQGGKLRQPQQERALHKVALILEAAMRLLNKGGLAQLSTNAVAKAAGVSIGTLYQYFPNKEAILDALADREMADLSTRVLQVLEDPRKLAHGDRVRRIMHEVLSTYGKRRRVHRLVIEHSLTRGGIGLAPTIQRVVAALTSGQHAATPVALTEAEAFVLANAFVGVMRAMIMRDEDTSPADEDIEQAFASLIAVYAEHGLSNRK